MEMEGRATAGGGGGGGGGGGRVRVVVIGGTGELGQKVVQASVACGHATYAFVRPASFSNPSKAPLLHSFLSLGVTLLQGTLEDYKSLLEAIKHVDIVISSTNSKNYLEELKILSAIQEVGNIKRFVLIDYIVTRNVSKNVKIYGALRSLRDTKERVREGVSASQVPFTHIITYGFASYYAASLGQLDCRSPPMDKVVIAVNGDHKAYIVADEDIAMYTVKVATDPRAINKNVHLRLPKNHLSQNELVSLWESKAHIHLEKVYESEEEMRKFMEGDSTASTFKSLKYFPFAQGGHNTPLYKDLDDVEVMDLYPEYEYVTVDQYLDRFVK